MTSRQQKQGGGYSNDDYPDERINTIENEHSNINKYNFTKPILEGNQRNVELNSQNSNKYNQKDLYSEYKKELNEYVPQHTGSKKAENSYPNQNNTNNMKRAKSARNIPVMKEKKNEEKGNNKYNGSTSNNNKSKEKADYFNK